ncbi:alpha-tubulin suppressor-like RCC1 family protein [Orbus hercynius]|uniref:Alpha-tubulin suppressor-like RCC1 family protein n=2 Tax=Orbus hercynius TaxID=593135 RepID=A0A495RK87_9GAMM|nr:alpha-tubulin suppressor-like RCC1 family protein [Orbus hercynius]
MRWKIYITLSVYIILLPSLAMSRTTDAMILSTKIASGGMGQTNSVDTGITIENGDLWIWGFRGSGQQGNGSNEPSSSAPARVDYFVRNNINIVQATAGIYHIIALDEQGNVWGWGQNGYYHAGGGVCTEGHVKSPCLVLKDKNIVRVDAGEYVSYALSADGDVYTWGHGPYGQLGNGLKVSKSAVYKIPRSDFNGEAVVLLGAAYEGGYAITQSGGVYAWGDDEDNAFGYERSSAHEYVLKPLLLTNLAVDGSEITYMCGGQPFTNYLSSSGDVYGMGGNFSLGIGQKTGKTAGPALITTDIASMYCRYSGSIALTNDGTLLTWGFASSAFNIYGIIPTQREYYDVITKIDGGKEHFIYWTENGKAYGVGYGAGHKFSQSSNNNVEFPGKELTFLLDEMKKTYGNNYIPGQGL